MHMYMIIRLTYTNSFKVFTTSNKSIVPLLFTNAWNSIGSEGVWCCNGVYPTSSCHCGMVFNYEYGHQGIGYYPSGSTTMVGMKDTDDWEDHVFPHGTHYDWDDSDYTFLLVVMHVQ